MPTYRLEYLAMAEPRHADLIQHQVLTNLGAEDLRTCSVRAAHGTVSVLLTWTADDDAAALEQAARIRTTPHAGQITTLTTGRGKNRRSLR